MFKLFAASLIEATRPLTMSGNTPTDWRIEEDQRRRAHGSNRRRNLPQVPSPRNEAKTSA